MFSVVLNSYRVVVDEEQVMLGNDLLLKCHIPSFEADFVAVDGWVDSEGRSIVQGGSYEGNLQTMACCAFYLRREAQTMLIVLGFQVPN